MTAAAPAPERRFAVIVGSGFAGLAAAIKLREAGLDFVVLEKGDAIGGTWRDNDYPGCACDVPAHLYSYSFAPNPDWSCAFAPQAEIRAYIERCADRWLIRPNVRFGAAVRSAVLDEDTATWEVACVDGRRFVADVVFAATGGLSRPLIPALPGLDRFAGPSWHSAAWRHDVPLAGKRVAAVGTGASAIQFVPRIAPEVGHLTLLQRTAPWVLPRPEHTFTARERRLFHVEPVRWLYRQSLYWKMEARAIPFTLEPRILRLAQRLAIGHIHRQIRDPELRRKVTPTFAMGCKRILMSNDYYPALARANVDVVTAGIREVTAGGVVDETGREHEVDAIVFGTGFDVHDYIGPIDVIGRGGADLRARWSRRAEAYLGTMVPDFPNLFVMTGPNTGLGHNSMIVMMEAQLRLAMSCLRAMRAGGVALVEPRAEATRRFNDDLQARVGRTVWSSGCKSWYLNADGINTVLWPGSTAEFVMRTRRFHPAAYRMVRRDELPARRAEPGRAA